MFSLQRLLGRPNQFFGLLEQSAQASCDAAGALHTLVSTPTAAPKLDDFIAARRREKALALELEEMLTRIFVTPLEREDIESLSDRLYRIPKTIEKFAERYELTWSKIKDVDFASAAAMLKNATELVREMISGLKAYSELSELKSIDARLDQIEANASDLILESVRRLYASGDDELKVIIAKDLYDILAEAIERCSDIGSVLAHVVLKNT